MIPGLPSIGGPELIIFLVIILLLFGAKRIPALARSLGKGTREFRQGIRQGTDDNKDEVREEKDEEKLAVEGASPLAEATRPEQKS